MSPMSQEIVGLDLAKNVFQAHAIDAEGKPIARQRLCQLPYPILPMPIRAKVSQHLGSRNQSRQKV